MLRQARGRPTDQGAARRATGPHRKADARQAVLPAGRQHDRGLGRRRARPPRWARTGPRRHPPGPKPGSPWTSTGPPGGLVLVSPEPGDGIDLLPAHVVKAPPPTPGVRPRLAHGLPPVRPVEPRPGLGEFLLRDPRRTRSAWEFRRERDPSLGGAHERRLAGKRPGQAPLFVPLEEAELLRRVADQKVLGVLVVHAPHRS